MSFSARTQDDDADQPSSELFGRAASDVFEAARERFFLWSPVCLGAGIAIYFAMPREPQMAVAFLPLALACISRAAIHRGRISAAVLTALILAGAGFAIAKLRVEAVRAPVLAKTLRNAEVTGIVTLVEAKFPRGQRLTIAPLKIADIAAEKTPAVIRVRTMSSRSAAAPGDRVRLKATLSPPAKPALPGGFDYARRHGSILSAPSVTPLRLPSRSASMTAR